MKRYLGIDVGSVNVKLALIDEGGEILHLGVQRIAGNPKIAINTLLKRLSEKFRLDEIAAAGVSGSGKGAVPPAFHWAEYSSSLAIISGLLHHHADAKTIIQIGGQSSLAVVLEDGLKKPWKVAANPLCAAGTGRFLEQQAYRLGIGIEDFAGLALKCQGAPPRIAARCSVFAKSDLIHLQQKGVPVSAMLYALCESIARMVASLQKGTFPPPVYFVGGVAANAAIIKALSEVLAARNGQPVEVIVPQNYLYMEALGAALLSRDKISAVNLLPEGDARQRYFEMPRLPEVSLPSNGAKLAINASLRGYLGVDVGSTSTKAVIMDESGKTILAKHYLMTAGRPVDAVKEVFRNLRQAGADNVAIAGVGVTGSGRYLIGSMIGADLIKNEITAQTRAAYDIDPEADIIEIGGQDSKLVIKRNGVVVDYQMNKACAAGTGSFIDELAEMLGVSVKSGEFAELAFTAPHTIDLGTRCAAFMGQAVSSAQQEGVPLPIITASLANSIAKNYLSKVVGTRKLGDRIILTGAVFYNRAVVAAFSDQLKGKTLTVAEHREVSGAIGAALLAKESMNGAESKFKGFTKVIEGDYNLSTFTCQGCDNNCAITQMKMPGEKPTFYGSRCDRYDSTLSQAKRETFFDEREKLLFRDYHAGTGSGPLVGIPRALMVYDYAPLLIGFLNALGVRVALSGKTSKQIMEHAIELAYTDSCFPMKLLHGHAAALKNADYILYPCAIRLGKKDGEEDQKYACPLIQASPYIVRQVLGLGDKLLIPIIDFSRGDADVIKNLADIAVRLGFSKDAGRQAAAAGIDAQRRFEADRTVLGEKLLEQLRESDKLGVVLLTRSYMSQDSGANLGIAEKLAQLGVVPVPLDFLPLASIDPKKYSDRPYWSYEGKFIAGAAISANASRLYSLALTNFGCGPNSFIIKLLEDIMGSKPLGQLEIDEHAAEAGLVTRLEAYVDTITSYARARGEVQAPRRDIYRGTNTSISAGKTVLIPRMTPHAEAVAAAMVSYGVKAVVLPEPDERNLLYANQYTAGTECLPYRVTLGDFLRYFHEHNGDGLDNVEGLMSGSYGPCRLGKYAVEQIRVLKDVGFNLPIRTTVSNNAYRDLNLGPGFERLAWKGIVTVDYLQKLLWRTRPYEKEKGAADKLFDEYLKEIAGAISNKVNLRGVLRKAPADFMALVDKELPRRPLVGINGEIYLRSNRFSNRDLVRVCEAAGLEAAVSPMGEWIRYTSYRNLEDAVKNRRLSQTVRSYLRKLVQERDEGGIAGYFHGVVDGHEPATGEILAKSAQYLSPRCGSEAVLSIGSGIDWLENPEFAGVISVMPHGCMPGGIVAAMAEKFSTAYEKPWISLTYDGFIESSNMVKINEFAELVKFCNENGRKT
ncbi:MAG: acyl-CoA dehydratase activase [Dehalococcoidales bacterium]|nr:acyl-CoA dehydratase activase [Dehalococcoidales bacterium]